jgi:hypothetical protein
LAQEHFVSVLLAAENLALAVVANVMLFAGEDSVSFACDNYVVVLEKRAVTNKFGGALCD